MRFDVDVSNIDVPSDLQEMCNSPETFFSMKPVRRWVAKSFHAFQIVAHNDTGISMVASILVRRGALYGIARYYRSIMHYTVTFDVAVSTKTVSVPVVLKIVSL